MAEADPPRVDTSQIDDLWLPEWDQGIGKSLPYRPLPTTVEGITAEWLTKALSSRFPGLVVNSREITREKHGFTSLIWLTLDLNDAGREAGVPEHVVLKGGFSPISETASFGYGMEAHSYRDIWPHTSLNLPKTFFVDLERATKQCITIMEDLADRNVVFGHGMKPVSYKAMSARISALARLHAETWDSPELKEGGKFHSVLPNGTRLHRLHLETDGFVDMPREEFNAGKSVLRMTPPFFTPEGWEKVFEEKMTPGAITPRDFRDYEWNRRATLYLENLSDRLPHVLVHGDTHPGNLFDEPDGTPGFFDHMPRREPPWIELGWTINTGCDLLDRKNWERALIGQYVAELGRNGIDIDFDESYRYYSLFLHQCYLWFVKNDPMWQSWAFNTGNTMRCWAAMIDNGTKQLLDLAMAEEALAAASLPAEGGAA